MITVKSILLWRQEHAIDYVLACFYVIHDGRYPSQASNPLMGIQPEVIRINISASVLKGIK
ncbi:hypothetical protein KHA96_08485 [Bacillus sp. FJAT-49711]|uniref:hypothetical protein n=1 Tax=Bacillus sp. FJAT-49711 TaxID=2833585 RepID=UPI001BCA4D52|nr:hypothetical protein [Bacillus sp. FJAT-49711]MBS4218346.1 hypothetical protein [Bacillus sp. FJAT-49711]